MIIFLKWLSIFKLPLHKFLLTSSQQNLDYGGGGGCGVILEGTSLILFVVVWVLDSKFSWSNTKILLALPYKLYLLKSLWLLFDLNFTSICSLNVCKCSHKLKNDKIISIKGQKKVVYNCIFTASQLWVGVLKSCVDDTNVSNLQ